MPSPSAFSVVFCVEPGYLCGQAALLADSFRAFAGAFRDAPLFAVQPRASGPIPSETRRALDAAGVEFVAEDLNREFGDSPPTNKVFAAEWVARRATTEFVVFTDTDCVVLNPPDAAVLPAGVDVAVQPVVKKFRGTSHPFDRNASLWRRMHARVGVRRPPFVRTTVDQVRIRAYYNAGIVVFRRSTGFATTWLEMLRAIDPVVVKDARENLDQFALALAAARHGRVGILPAHYNYSIARRREYAPPFDTVSLEALTHVHYHGSFFEPDFLPNLVPGFDRQEMRYRWLADRLPLQRG